MRFLPHGPSIPDELLLARDQGRVIFFCGAGVSRARAKMPDFFGLAEKVITKLKVQSNSPARKLIREAKEIDERVGIPGVISADRVFGILEGDFPSRDIEEAVAFALKPRPSCDLSAHRILLDLATTPDGVVQLVTTNFDRLFDDCGRGLKVSMPPKLPDPLRPKDIDGIVYLHGRCTPEYLGAEGDGFVLSSSEFGRAYLSDGWGTSFIQKILERYIVVFIGYTADDPPVKYLLEALGKSKGKLQRAFAFQSGEKEDAAARWRQKGVEAIPYNAENDHVALWSSLEAWAERACDVEAWYRKVITAAKKGPSALNPHERGQVAHIVSTYEGVKRFGEGDDPPPADWLYVFDPRRRFAKPGRALSYDGEKPYVDPFDLYGLDSDDSPPRIDPEDYYAKRELPSDAWDAFALNRLDYTSLSDEHLSSLRGHFADNSPRLVPRIAQLGAWIAKVCDQSYAIWWAAQQSALHENIQNHISWELDNSKRAIHTSIKEVWRYLFESWKENSKGSYHDFYSLKEMTGKTGWSSISIRELGRILSPRLSANADSWNGPTPPKIDNPEEVWRLIKRDVKYPEVHESFIFPDEWCASGVKALRHNLELALMLETEIGGYGLKNLAPITEDSSIKSDGYGRTHGLSGAIIQFSQHFSRLVKVDRLAAQHELACWPSNDDTIFSLLRIWAAGIKEAIPAEKFQEIILSLSNKAFWNINYQRDLLIAIGTRWKDLDSDDRQYIEARILEGRERWKNEDSSDFIERKASLTLSRIQWLESNGCEFSSDLSKKIEGLLKAAPNWKPKNASDAARSTESQGGWVQTKTNYESLLGIPLSSVLIEAQNLSGRSEDFLTENDPFSGLSADVPVRALSSLTWAMKKGDFPEWAWRRFLTSDARKKDKAKLAYLTAKRVASFPDQSLAPIIRSAADWLYAASSNLDPKCIGTFDLALHKLVNVLLEYPDSGKSGVGRVNKIPDWTMEAINSPTGKIAEAIFNDPRKNNLFAGQGLPEEWRRNVEALLNLPGDLGRHTLVILFHNLNWFYAVDAGWTKDHLLTVLHRSEPYDRDAAWSGFLWGATIPNRDLYMQLKADLIALPFNRLPSRKSYKNIIAAMILAGWANTDDEGNRYISDDEMHAMLLKVDDKFRSHILWQIQHWISEKGGNFDDIWKSQLLDFIKIWPRQISAKSSKVSARLCELAFSSDDQLPAIVDLILPLLTKIGRDDHLMLLELRRSEDSIVDRYPERVLAVLYAVLADDALAWPYGIDSTIGRIEEANAELSKDERLIELKRRWDAR